MPLKEALTTLAIANALIAESAARAPRHERTPEPTPTKANPTKKAKRKTKQKSQRKNRRK